MTPVVGQNEAVAEWVAQRIPAMESGRDFGACTTIGVVDRNQIPIAGVVFHNWQPRYSSIEISCAADRSTWLTKSLIRFILGHAFDGVGCNRLQAITPRKNHTARRFLENLGFKREGLARAGFGSDDAVIYSMLAREWRSSRFRLDGKEHVSPQGSRPRRHGAGADRIQSANSGV